MKIVRDNYYDCQCNIFSKKNNIVTHKNNKISFKDKNGLANKFGLNEDSLKKPKKKISINGRSQEKNKLQNKDQISRKFQSIKNAEYRHTYGMSPAPTSFAVNFANIIKPPAIHHYSVQSPAIIQNTILTSQYFTGGQSNSKIKRVEFSYESNNSKVDDNIRNTSLKNLKESGNLKTEDTLKKSDSQTVLVQKKKSLIIQNMKMKTNNPDVKQTNRLSVLKAKSIISSGESNKQECCSQYSEVIQSLLKRNNLHKPSFYFNAEDQ